MNMETILDDMQYEFAQKIHDLPYVSADKLGLDPRAGYKIGVGEDFLVVDNHYLGSLNYYGGFEYVDSTARYTVLGYTVFLANYCDRVRECVDFYHEKSNP